MHGISQAKLLEWVAVSSPGDLPNPGIKPTSLVSPALAGGFFTTVPPRYPLNEELLLPPCNLEILMSEKIIVSDSLCSDF